MSFRHISLLDPWVAEEHLPPTPPQGVTQESRSSIHRQENCGYTSGSEGPKHFVMLRAKTKDIEHPFFKPFSKPIDPAPHPLHRRGTALSTKFDRLNFGDSATEPSQGPRFGRSTSESRYYALSFKRCSEPATGRLVVRESWATTLILCGALDFFLRINLGGIKSKSMALGRRASLSRHRRRHDDSCGPSHFAQKHATG